jgi:hypothetical protein
LVWNKGEGITGMQVHFMTILVRPSGSNFEALIYIILQDISHFFDHEGAGSMIHLYHPPPPGPISPLLSFKIEMVGEIIIAV